MFAIKCTKIRRKGNRHNSFNKKSILSTKSRNHDIKEKTKKENFFTNKMKDPTRLKNQSLMYLEQIQQPSIVQCLLKKVC